MAIEIKDWTKQIEDLSILGLEQLHEVYSEMLATAHDIGYVVPDEQLVETDDDTKLREVIEALHPEIVKFAAENSRDSADKGAKKTAAPKAQKKPRAATTAKKKAAASPKKPAKPVEQKGEEDVDQKASTTMASAKRTTKTPAKKAKKAPAKKTAKKASATNARTPVGRSKFKPEAVINVKLKENPARAGTGRFDRVANLMKHNGKTVEQFLKSGGKTGTLNYSAAQGWITVK